MPEPVLPPAPASSIPEVAFVLELGRALQTFGTSAPTLEKALGRVAAHLGLEGAIWATPTAFLASLRKEGHHSKTYLQRIEAGESDLDRLAAAQEAVDRVVAGGMDVASARAHLASLISRPPRFGRWEVIASYGLCGAGAARIFGGGWREALLGLPLGLLVGLVVQAVQARRAVARMTPLLGALAGALGAAFLVHLVGQASYSVLVLSGIIVLVPGLGLLVSMQELGTGNLVAGTARLAGTLLVFLLLGFGVALGTHLIPARLAVAAQPVPLPAWTLLPALLAMPLAFIVAFRGRLRDYGWTLAASLLAWSAATLGTTALGPVAGAGLAAWLLGAGCNLYARRTRRPAAVLQLPALMLILPGSLGFRGLSMVLEQQILAGLQVGFQALFVSLALMLGLMLANATVPRRSF